MRMSGEWPGGAVVSRDRGQRPCCHRQARKQIPRRLLEVTYSQRIEVDTEGIAQFRVRHLLGECHDFSSIPSGASRTVLRRRVQEAQNIGNDSGGKSAAEAATSHETSPS